MDLSSWASASTLALSVISIVTIGGSLGGYMNHSQAQAVFVLKSSEIFRGEVVPLNLRGKSGVVRGILRLVVRHNSLSQWYKAFDIITTGISFGASRYFLSKKMKKSRYLSTSFNISNIVSDSF